MEARLTPQTNPQSPDGQAAARRKFIPIWIWRPASAAWVVCLRVARRFMLVNKPTFFILITACAAAFIWYFSPGSALKADADRLYEAIITKSIQCSAISALAAVNALPGAFTAFFITNKDNLYRSFSKLELLTARFGFNALVMLLGQFAMFMLVCISIVRGDCPVLFFISLTLVLWLLLISFFQNVTIHFPGMLNRAISLRLKYDLKYRLRVASFRQFVQRRAGSNAKSEWICRGLNRKLQYAEILVIGNYRKLGDYALHEYSRYRTELSEFFVEEICALLNAAQKSGAVPYAHTLLRNIAHNLLSERENAEKLAAFFQCVSALLGKCSVTGGKDAAILLSGVACVAVECLPQVETVEFIYKLIELRSGSFVRHGVFLAMLGMAYYLIGRGVKKPDLAIAMRWAVRDPAVTDEDQETLLTLTGIWREADAEDADVFGSILYQLQNPYPPLPLIRT